MDTLKYKVMGETDVEIDGTTYAPGAIVELTAAVAEPFVSAGTLEEVKDEKSAEE